ncbi:hypothetical protein ACFQ4X_06950 [Fictibacillus halophilus]|uniref:hypothetical protein n=1 Tax=Fictibacillus halophilus TaxID=1610490 RepID=UPI00363502FA
MTFTKRKAIHLFMIKTHHNKTLVTKYTKHEFNKYVFSYGQFSYRAKLQDNSIMIEVLYGNYVMDFLWFHPETMELDLDYQLKIEGG